MWLIDTLSTSPLTFSDIQKKWLYASANEDGDPLFERTFNRYRREAESLMYVDIKCDKSDGNLYKIVRPEGFKNNDLQECEYITPNVPLVSLTNVPDISLLNVPLFTGCN